MVYILLSIAIIWSFQFSYYKVMEHTLVDIADKIEKEVTSDYFSGREKDFSLQKSNLPFVIQVYKYMNNKYTLFASSTDKDLLSETSEFPEGFHVALLNVMNKQQYYATYDKTFEVYKDKYHIVVLRSLCTFIDMKKDFFILILIFGGFIYILALFFGYRYNVRLMTPMHQIIESTSLISSDNVKEHLTLPKIKDEFFTLAETINSMLERLDSTLLKTKHFNAKVSHELRTPLTIMRGEIEVALNKDRSIIEYKELLYSTLEEVDTLQAITDNMLLLTKFNVKPLQIKKLNVRLDKVIEEAIASCRIQFEAKSIRINSTLDPVVYLMEEVLIKQSIKNLINNAIKYSPKETLVHISLKKEGKKIIFMIQDEGYGISEEDLAHIFELHYRSKDKKLEHIPGNGLGLPIVHYTLALHDATLTATSTLGRGSCFIISF